MKFAEFFQLFYLLHRAYHQKNHFYIVDNGSPVSIDWFLAWLAQRGERYQLLQPDEYELDESCLIHVKKLPGTLEHLVGADRMHREFFACAHRNQRPFLFLESDQFEADNLAEMLAASGFDFWSSYWFGGKEGISQCVYYCSAAYVLHRYVLKNIIQAPLSLKDEIVAKRSLIVKYPDNHMVFQVGPDEKERTAGRINVHDLDAESLTRFLHYITSNAILPGFCRDEFAEYSRNYVARLKEGGYEEVRRDYSGKVWWGERASL